MRNIGPGGTTSSRCRKPMSQGQGMGRKRKLGWSAESDTSGLRSLASPASLSLDEFPLEFGQSPKRRQHQSPMRGHCICPTVTEGFEPNVPLGQGYAGRLLRSTGRLARARHGRQSSLCNHDERGQNGETEGLVGPGGRRMGVTNSLAKQKTFIGGSGIV